MYLLSSKRIEYYVKASFDANAPLCIKNFNPTNLQHTFYYFCLGANIIYMNESCPEGKSLDLSNGKEKYFTLEPGDFVTITTRETFRMSERIMGVLGQCGDRVKEGLLLIHSPFIDPCYHGKLKFGLKNIGHKKIRLEYEKSIIGKVSFFDISDTYPIHIKEGSIMDKKINLED